MVQNPLNSKSNQAACQPSRLSALVQQLIIEAKDQAILSSCELDYPEGSDVILDFEFDGVRCVLIRLQPLEDRETVTLSPRELEIVRMVAKGHPNKVIAGVLNISPWTVCTHVRRIFAKLGVVSRAAMIARFLELEKHGNPGNIPKLGSEKSPRQLPINSMAIRPDWSANRLKPGRPQTA